MQKLYYFSIRHFLKLLRLSDHLNLNKPNGMLSVSKEWDLSQCLISFLFKSRGSAQSQATSSKQAQQIHIIQGHSQQTEFPSMSGHISFRGTGNRGKSESAGYPTGQQTSVPITPRGSPAQLKESAHIIISDTSICFSQFDLSI